MNSNITFITLGCRINTYETEVMREKLANLQLDKKFIIINSCAVTGEAERQCRQLIRKTKKENPEAIIIITGCAAQVNAFSFSQKAEVD